MSEPKKTLEERIQEKTRRQQALQEKAKQVQAQLRKLEQQQKAEDRKRRTHRLISIGGAVENAFGREISEAELPSLIAFLKTQDAWYQKYLEKNHPEVVSNSGIVTASNEG